MLAVSLSQMHGVRVSPALVASHAQPKAAPVLRRRAGLALSGFVLLLSSSRPALACAFCCFAVCATKAAHSPSLALCADGGSGNIRSTDEGSGNPRYEALVADLKARGAVPSTMERRSDDKTPVLSREKCLTGREKACQ